MAVVAQIMGTGPEGDNLSATVTVEQTDGRTDCVDLTVMNNLNSSGVIGRICFNITGVSPDNVELDNENIGFALAENTQCVCCPGTFDLGLLFDDQQARIEVGEALTFRLCTENGTDFDPDVFSEEDICLHFQQLDPDEEGSQCVTGEFNGAPTTTMEPTTTAPPTTTMEPTTTMPPQVECHDICVQDVKYICRRRLRGLELPISNFCGGRQPGNCRGEKDVVSPEDLVIRDVIVTCAQEELADDCRSVIVTVGLQFIVENDNTGSKLCIDKEIMFECRRFRRFPDGTVVRGDALEEALKFIDGSCIVVDLTVDDIEIDTNDAGETIIRFLRGFIIDKLWKHEDLWVQAAQPYPDNTITVKQEFEAPHAIDACNGTIVMPEPDMEDDE